MTATVRPADRVLIRNARMEAHLARPANSQAVLVPSILPAPHPAVMRRLAAAMAVQLAHLARVPALAHGLALAHPVLVVRPVPAARQPVKRLVRSALLREAAAVVRSIPKRRKAR